METEDLLLASVRHLVSLNKRGTEYDALVASGVLRKLLMDGQPLLHQVNRTYRVDIRFRACPLAPLPDALAPAAAAMFSPDRIYPYRSNDAPAQILKLDQFLGMRVAEVKGTEIHVADAIRFGANHEGGIHRDRKKADELLLEAANYYQVDRMNPITATVRAIGRVTIDALNPLVQRILGLPGSVDGLP